MMKDNLVETTIQLLSENFRDYTADIEELEDDLDRLLELLNDAKLDEDWESVETYEKEIADIEVSLQKLRNIQLDEYEEEIDKLPKETNKTNFEGFDISKTDPSAAEDYIPGNPNREYMLKKYKYLGSHIAEMTPDEYLLLCGKYGWKQQFNNVDEKYDNLSDQSKENIHKYAERMKNGEKAPMPYIDIKRQGQEGRHRAFAAKEAGIEKIPVLLIY